MSRGKIFISYARADGEFALKLAKDLRASKVDIWMDQLDSFGVQSLQTIEEAMVMCESILVIISYAYKNSKSTQYELAAALRRNKEILLVIYQSCKIPRQIRTNKYTDFTYHYNAGMRQLLIDLEDETPVGKHDPGFVMGILTLVLIITAIAGIMIYQPIKEDKSVINRSEEINVLNSEYLQTQEQNSDRRKKNVSRFTLLAGGQAVYDRKTGLTWQRSCYFGLVPYKHAFRYVRQLNRKGYAGYSDWRLPTVEEAISLLRPGENKNGLFINDLLDNRHGSIRSIIWTIDKESERSAWAVDFAQARNYASDTGTLCSVRAVR